jgi:hypothetical protein
VLKSIGRVLPPEQRAQFILRRNPCPPDEPGAPTINLWIASIAGKFSVAGIPQELQVDLIRTAMTRPEKSRTEVIRTVARACQAAPSGVPAEKREAPPSEYNPDLLARYAAMVETEITDDWLMEQSPECVLDMTPHDYLSVIHPSGEVAIATSRPQTPKVTDVPLGTWEAALPPGDVNQFATGMPGVWYNINTGPTWRLEDGTGFRYAMFESDVVPDELWRRVIVLMRLPIVAIHTSGSRSVHTLWAVDAESPDDWQRKVAPVKRGLIRLGACTNTWKPAQLSRLPGCMRAETGREQRLLYLDGSPSGDPIWKEKKPGVTSTGLN